MLFDQIAKKRPEGVALFLFRQDAGNIARNRIRSSGSNFPVDSGELMFRQADGDLRHGHTNIIPPVSPPNGQPWRLHWSVESRPAFEVPVASSDWSRRPRKPVRKPVQKTRQPDLRDLSSRVHPRKSTRAGQADGFSSRVFLFISFLLFDLCL